MDISQVTWRKSSYSGGNGGECVEVASTGKALVIRDSKDPHGPKLTSTLYGWQAFTRWVEKRPLDIR